MIKIYDFEKCHIDEAQEIAVINYQEERIAVPALPETANSIPVHQQTKKLYSTSVY